jgi:hypothetical protein
LRRVTLLSDTACHFTLLDSLDKRCSSVDAFLGELSLRACYELLCTLQQAGNLVARGALIQDLLEVLTHLDVIAESGHRWW